MSMCNGIFGRNLDVLGTLYIAELFQAWMPEKPQCGQGCLLCGGGVNKYKFNQSS